MNLDSVFINSYLKQLNIEGKTNNSSKNVGDLNSFSQKLFSEILDSLLGSNSDAKDTSNMGYTEFLSESLNKQLTNFRSNKANTPSSYNSVNKVQAYKKNMNSNVTLSNNQLKDKFSGDLFLGDSITKGLESYNILTPNQVCAKVGNTTTQVSKMVDDLPSSENPKRIFIMCGVNDLGSLTTQQFSKNYSELIEKVKARFPNSNVYVQSVLPVSPTTEQNKAYLSNSKINEYNSALTKIAKDENVAFVDVASLVKGKEYYHEPDGIHFNSSFYPVWLNYVSNLG